MKWFAISGTWNIPNKELAETVKRDVQQTVEQIFKEGNGIVIGGALGVDQWALEVALRLDPTARRTIVIIPTPLFVYVKHYRDSAKKGRITDEQADVLIKSLCALQERDLCALHEMSCKVCNPVTYYLRNGKIIDAADALYAFQVDGSRGTQDTIEKARKKGVPVTLRRYKTCPSLEEVMPEAEAVPPLFTSPR